MNLSCIIVNIEDYIAEGVEDVLTRTEVVWCGPGFTKVRIVTTISPSKETFQGEVESAGFIVHTSKNEDEFFRSLDAYNVELGEPWDENDVVELTEKGKALLSSIPKLSQFAYVSEDEILRRFEDECPRLHFSQKEARDVQR